MTLENMYRNYTDVSLARPLLLLLRDAALHEILPNVMNKDTIRNTYFYHALFVSTS